MVRALLACISAFGVSLLSKPSGARRRLVVRLGMAPALYAGGDGGSARKEYRQLLISTLEPCASIITAEFREKVGYPISLDFKKLAAADVAACARAYATLVASGVDK